MTKQDEGKDFASAAMMRLVAAGLKRQGIEIPVPQSSGAHVPRVKKRDALSKVLSEHGPVAILSIADATPFLPPEPVVQALVMAKDITDLFDRWQRLERFSHRRHTVDIESIGMGRYRLRHRARDEGPQPSFAESLLVLGLLTKLTEMIGSADVLLESLEGNFWRKDGLWIEPAATAKGAYVILSTSGVPAMTTLDENGLPGDPIAALSQRLEADPLRRWTVAELAAEVGASPRTLQRRLAEQSVSFSQLVADARLRVAAFHLTDARGPGLAEIGFLSGYSDQSHFTRTFSRSVGTTPSSYRADFSQ